MQVPAGFAAASPQSKRKKPPPAALSPPTSYAARLETGNAGSPTSTDDEKLAPDSESEERFQSTAVLSSSDPKTTKKPSYERVFHAKSSQFDNVLTASPSTKANDKRYNILGSANRNQLSNASSPYYNSLGSRSLSSQTNNTSPSSAYAPNRATAYSSPSSLQSSSTSLPATISGPLTTPSRYLITVIPPITLPHDPPHPRISPFASGYGPAKNFQ